MFEPSKPSYGRKKFSVNLIHKHPRSNHDDEWTFNTQISSVSLRWDETNRSNGMDCVISPISGRK